MIGWLCARSTIRLSFGDESRKLRRLMATELKAAPHHIGYNECWKQLMSQLGRQRKPFNHQTNSLLFARIARSPVSHIFIPGDIPFISFLLVAGPCAPTPSTSSETCTLPAFSNSKVIGSLSPFFSGLFKSIIIK